MRANAAENITLRGIGPANQDNFNTNAPVGLYMDEIYQSFDAAPGVQFFDLSRIGVLKGPQGTLYGRNTTGGLVNFISNMPDLSGGYNGNLDIGYGNRNSLHVEGATDINLIPNELAMRIAVFHSSGDGYLKNIEPTGPSTFGSNNTWQERVTLRYAPSEDFDATLRFYGNDQTGSGSGFLGTGVFPGEVTVTGFSRAGLGKYDVATDYPNATSDSQSVDSALTINWRSGPFTVTSVTSGEYSRALLSDDCDGTPANLCEISSSVRGNQVSEDLRLQYAANGLNLTTGLFYGRDVFDFRTNVGFFDSAFVQPSYVQTRQSYAAYADAS